MKANTILLILCAGLISLLCGCGAAKNPAPDAPAQSEQMETGGEPMDITAFSFQHRASYADGCYLFELKRTDEGTHLYAEEQFSNGRVADAMIDDSALEQLGRLAGDCRIDRWDGFDETNKRVRDGTGFALNVTLADGSTISARGSNAFPGNYSEVCSGIEALYVQLMEEYSNVGGETEEDPAGSEESGSPSRDTVLKEGADVS